MPYAVRFSKEAFKDAKTLSPRLRKKLQDIILNRISTDPYSGKRLVGDLTGLFSVRLSFQDRIVYSIDEENQVVFIHRARTHYGE